MTGRLHDPEHSVLRCSRNDLLAVPAGQVADGLVAGDQLVAAALTVREPVVRFAVLTEGGTTDGYVGQQLTVTLPTTDPDRVVGVGLTATAALARTLHRALDPPVRSDPTGSPTSHPDWDDAVDAVGTDQLRQLRWSDDDGVPEAAALVLAVGRDRIRRLCRGDDATVVEDVDPAQVWSACCVLAARAERVLRGAPATLDRKRLQ